MDDDAETQLWTITLSGSFKDTNKKFLDWLKTSDQTVKISDVRSRPIPLFRVRCSSSVIGALKEKKFPWIVSIDEFIPIKLHLVRDELPDEYL